MDIKSSLIELMVLCYEVNSTTEHDVFIYFHGHTDHIDVDIVEGGFRRGSGKRVNIFSAWRCDLDSILDDINEAIEKLKEYL